MFPVFMREKLGLKAGSRVFFTGSGTFGVDHKSSGFNSKSQGLSKSKKFRPVTDLGKHFLIVEQGEAYIQAASNKSNNQSVALMCVSTKKK